MLFMFLLIIIFIMILFFFQPEKDKWIFSYFNHLKRYKGEDKEKLKGRE